MAKGTATATGTAMATATARDWAELPTDVLYLIFGNLTSFEILWPVQAVCRTWCQVALEPRLWRRLDIRYPSELVDQSFMEKLIREAVDRSGGNVNEVYANISGTNEILTYIADRSTGVKFLSLQSTTGIDGEGLVEFVRRCPMMEELQIEGVYFSPETHGGIGRACPHLKRFSLIKIFSFTDVPCDEDAQEIANNMPLLRELKLYGNPLTNTGLAIIFSKCRHLESLDLGACFYLRLDEGMKAKLNAGIKNVKLPRLPNVK